MNRGKRMTALFLAFVMVFAAAFTASPASVSAAKKKVTVKSVTTKSSLSGNKKTLYVAKGKKVKLSTTVNVKPNKAANKKVTYKSADPGIATVSAKGEVKGVKEGNTKITVTSRKSTKQKATIQVKVTKVPVTRVTISQKSATLEEGATLSLKAKVKAKKGAVKTIGWKSSNKKVAKVSSKGVVTAVAAGTARITAQAIDGSGKKAVCNVTVKDSVSLTGMTILNHYTISFSLSKPFALNAGQVAVTAKKNANGAYRGNMAVESLSTNDNVNYNLILEDRVSVGTYLRLSVPSLTGVKTLEKQYMEPVCNFTDDEIHYGEVGEQVDWGMQFDESEGYSQYSISRLPAGLKSEAGPYGLIISGMPTAAGVTSAVLTAIDEFGNTLTRNVVFAIGSDKVLAGAAAPVYCLASNDGSTSVRVNAVGGSGSYKCELISGQDKGIKLVHDVYRGYHIEAPTKVAGTYSAVVRVTDENNAALHCDISYVFHVAQGISIGGCIKDAQGNPIPYGFVEFTNKNRSDRYCSYRSTSADDNGIYSAVVAPGTYDMAVSKSNEADAATGTYYATSQVLNATRSGFDFTLPLYKVSLVTSDDSIQLEREWRINGECAGHSSTLYLKAGSYMLESTANSEETTTISGDWFNGKTRTTTYKPVKYSASVKIVNAAVQVGVTKAANGAPETSTHTCPAAKDTTYFLTIDSDYSNSIPEIYDNYGHFLYTALQVNVPADGNYRLESVDGYVNLYDANGNMVAPSDGGNTKTYNGLKAGTYYIGTGSYDTNDYGIYMTTITDEKSGGEEEVAE